MRWLVPPHVVRGEDALLFDRNDQMGLYKIKDNLTAILVRFQNITSNPIHYETITTLIFPVSQVENGTTIKCAADGVSNNLNLYIASKFMWKNSSYTPLILVLSEKASLRHPKTLDKLH